MTGHTTLQFVIDFEHTMLGMYYAHIYNYAHELYPLCQTIPIMPNFFLIHQTLLLTCGAKHSSRGRFKCHHFQSQSQHYWRH